MPRIRPLILVAGLLVAIGVLAAGLYWACQHEPAFYRQALAQDLTAARHGSDALVREAAALASNLQRTGHWQALFTADQINGWLAYDMLQNHPHLLPPNISELRVAIEHDRAFIAFRWTKAAWSSIVMLETEMYLREDNVVAVRICKARAGLLPLPLGGLMRDLINAAEEIGLQIDPQQIDGDPVLLVTLPTASQKGDKLLSLESLELTRGELYLAGHTQRGVPTAAQLGPQNLQR